MVFLHTPNVNVQLPKAKIKKLLKGMRTSIHYLEAKDHINDYSERTLRKILQRNGFAHVKFTHLRPVQSVYGSKSRLLRSLKNAWFFSAVALFNATLGRINLDNLFAVARK